jgi:hypothetical protein
VKGGHIHDAGEGFNGVMRGIDADGRRRESTLEDGDYTPGEPDLIGIRGMPVSGQHNHTVSGGDPETRPRNMPVHYLIKVRS